MVARELLLEFSVQRLGHCLGGVESDERCPALWRTILTATNSVASPTSIKVVVPTMVGIESPDARGEDLAGVA